MTPGPSNDNHCRWECAIVSDRYLQQKPPKKGQCKVSPKASSDRICQVLHPTKATTCRQLHTMVYQFKILDECEHLILIPTKLYNRTSVSSCRVFFFFFLNYQISFPPQPLKPIISDSSFLKCICTKYEYIQFSKKNYTIKAYRYPMILYNWRVGHGKKLTLEGVMIYTWACISYIELYPYFSHKCYTYAKIMSTAILLFQGKWIYIVLC